MATAAFRSVVRRSCLLTSKGGPSISLATPSTAAFSTFRGDCSVNASPSLIQNQAVIRRPGSLRSAGFFSGASLSCIIDKASCDAPSGAVVDLTNVSDALTEAAAAAVVASPMPITYTPVGLMCQLLDAAHVTTGLPWWGTIACATVVIRLCVLPLWLRTVRSQGKLIEFKPKIDEHTKRIENARTEEEKKQRQMELQQFMVNSGWNPFASFVPMFIQSPIFITFFLSIQRMAEHLPSFKTGGALWFTDLTIADSTMAMPLMASSIMLLTIELGAEATTPMSKGVRWFMRGVFVCMIPVTINFPQGVFVYWVANSSYSLVQMLVFKTPALRRRLNLPIVAKEPAVAPVVVQPELFANKPKKAK